MENFKIFIQLTRLNKPIGIMLLFWPCLWGLSLGFNFYQNTNFYVYFYYTFLFFLGSVLMRSAGCIINDMVDVKFDKRVKRTKSRPLPSKKISFFSAGLYAIVLILIAFIVLMQFNSLTIILGISSMILAFSYPYMKRFTYWPQLYLGLTFNWGIIMGWCSITNNIGIEPILLYSAAIFWTLGYDTIYGLQDIADDEIIGVKSTSIKFKKNIKNFVGTCYFLSFLFFLILAMKINAEIYFFILLLLIVFHFGYQVKVLNYTKSSNCLKIFKSNNLIGFFIFLAISTLNIS